MTLQYIDKETDKSGADFRTISLNTATTEELRIAAGFVQDNLGFDVQVNPPPARRWQDEDFGVGGSLVDDPGPPSILSGGDTQAQFGDNDTDDGPIVGRRAPKHAPVRLQGGPGSIRSDRSIRGAGATEEGTSSYDIDRGDRPINALYDRTARRTYKKKF